MSDSEAIVEAFTDDAGNTGEDLDHPEQRNLFLACLVVPRTRAASFWTRIARAWQIAASLTRQPSAKVELKGEQLYGGRGPFTGVDLGERCKILDTIVDAVIAESTHVFWVGLPKHYWSCHLLDKQLNPNDLPFWKVTLQTFCKGMYELLDALYGPHEFRMTADENSWVHAGHLLRPHDREAWPRLLDGGIAFRSSAELRGLQAVDIVVHTLYRANKEARQTQRSHEEYPRCLVAGNQQLDERRGRHRRLHSA